MTLGVRMLTTNSKGEVMLVRHTYVPGWHLPGGGVDKGESCDAAVVRELYEETGLTPLTRPILVGLYFNLKTSKRDHVALYRCESADPVSSKVPDREIVEARFFALDELPHDVSGGTSRRLAELFDGAPLSPEW